MLYFYTIKAREKTAVAIRPTIINPGKQPALPFTSLLVKLSLYRLSVCKTEKGSKVRVSAELLHPQYKFNTQQLRAAQPPHTLMNPLTFDLTCCCFTSFIYKLLISAVYEAKHRYYCCSI